MKTRQVLTLIALILFGFGWLAPVQSQDIPANYIQNPNMEHDLNAIFWYGSCCDIWGWNGVANFPENYTVNIGDDAHSGNWVFNIPAGAYIWVSYPVRGHEEKTFKASFWYKGYFLNYWNFIYRDVGMTFEDLPPELAEYTGADSAAWSGEGQNALQFWFGGEDGYTEDWTYFEFVWDFPGTIPGWGNTSMWWATTEPAYLDDFYYGEWYDGQYSGEEPLDFINGDFEASDLNIEWLVNAQSWDQYFGNDFLSIDENHTEAGLQSLRLMDWDNSRIDTNDVVEPYDSIETVEWTTDRNVTYYLPALGAEGKDMELSFWYKGNDASVSLEFYDDYGVTTDDFPLPAGAYLVADTANPVYELDTAEILTDTMDQFVDTFTVADQGTHAEVHMNLIDTLTLAADEVLASQDFNDIDDLKLTAGAWVWSGAGNYDYDDWKGATTNDESYSGDDVMFEGNRSLWLPGDPGWGGAEGYINVVDDTNYIWEFMYTGQVQFILNLGATKYNLVDDVDGIVPPEADADTTTLTWMLDSDYWTRFRFEYHQGSWLADSGIASPAGISFNLLGTYTDGDLGYVDDFMVALASKADPEVIDTNFVVIDTRYKTQLVYDIDTLSTTYNPKSATWDLPAVTEWTKWSLNWTNPSNDIGGTLTMFLDSKLPDVPDYLDDEKTELDFEHAGWTYFDDFVYGISTGTHWKRSVTKKDLHVYPNPAVDMLYLSLEIPLSTVEIYNTTGQKVMMLNNPDRKFSVSELESGLYLLHATDTDGVIHEVKFIVK